MAKSLNTFFREFLRVISRERAIMNFNERCLLQIQMCMLKLLFRQTSNSFCSGVISRFATRQWYRRTVTFLRYYISSRHDFERISYWPQGLEHFKKYGKVRATDSDHYTDSCTAHSIVQDRRSTERAGSARRDDVMFIMEGEE